MIVLAFNGTTDRIQDNVAQSMTFGHDSAAVLVRDGEVVAAIEEERLNRIKHTNKFPINAMRACLEIAGVGWKDVDKIAHHWREDCVDRDNQHFYLDRRNPPPFRKGRAVYEALFEQELGVDVRGKLEFVEHHVGHAYSAFMGSGFDKCLVLTLDAMGDLGSGLVGRYDGSSFTVDEVLGQASSLGKLYIHLCGVIGYKHFDEYKVMGLAPYGDPKRYEDVFLSFYRLLPDGKFRINPALRWYGAPAAENDPAMAIMRVLPELQRGKNDSFDQKHCDWAAGLQQMLENIIMHHAAHHAKRTRMPYLALAGGVAHNCTANGKLLRSGLFRDVFVHPAAHDPGGLIGAAHYCEWQAERQTPKRLTSIFWGTDVGSESTIESELAAWSSVVDYHRSADVCVEGAELLANGAVIGWVQGRAEFGPRSLGNRSILADPRPASNKDRINEMVKKREGYRPFAPSVAAEAANEFFVCSAEGEPARDLPFMIFVVDVRPEKRELLGAITHVDGTARVQTVSEKQNPKYWRLISEFGRRTGVPIVLNTSFNNNAEPIVNTVREALTTFVTTQLDALVVGDFVVTKKRKKLEAADYQEFRVSLAPYQRIETSRGTKDGRQWRITTTIEDTVSWRLSEEAGRALMAANFPITVRELCGASTTLGAELLALWAERGVVLSPPT